MRLSRPAAVVLALVCALPLARALAPSDLFDNDQASPTQDIVDAAVNHAWLIQRRPSGELATKPALYPWLGAVAVRATGRTDEWVFKLPIVLAFGFATLLIGDLGRRELGATGGWLAAAFWMANFHVVKLLYTARTDMLVTAWVVLGLWCVQVQREAWRRGSRSGVGVIALFWASVAAAALTKGPPAALPGLWLLLAAALDRGGRASRPWAQAVGGIAALAVVLAWLVPVLRTHPEWLVTLNAEIAERATGTGSGAHRHDSMGAMPAYFLARFAPWSLLFVAAAWVAVSTVKPGTAAMPGSSARVRRWTPAWRDFRQAFPLAWTLEWVALVLVFFMIPRGRRADYFVPAYAGAAVLAAWLVVEAGRGAKAARAVVSLGLGATAVAAIAAGVAAAWLPKPGPMSWDVAAPAFAGVDLRAFFHAADAAVRVRTAAVLGAAAAACALAGAAGLLMLRRERFAAAGLAAAAGVAGIVVLYECSLESAPRLRTGDYFAPLTALARLRPPGGEGLPTAFLRVGDTPVQSLLGRNEPMDEPALARVDGGGMLLAGAGPWRAASARFDGRATVLVRTPRLEESGVSLVAIWIAPAADDEERSRSGDPRPRSSGRDGISAVKAQP